MAGPALGTGRGAGRHFDLVVVGAGSAAFAAAIEAGRAGRSVALIESGTVGGTCVNVGCVPSKALLANAQAFARARHHPFEGITAGVPGINLPRVVAQTDGLIEDLRGERYLDLAEAYGFAIIRGRATFAGPTMLWVNGEPVTGDRVIVATGVTPATPSIAGLAGTPHLTSTTALRLDVLPEHLIVVGANSIGLELGQAFLQLGVRVSFLEAAGSIAPFEEPEIAEILSEVLRGDGAEIHTGVRLQRVSGGPGRVSVEFSQGDLEETISGSHLLVATGRRPSHHGLDLEAAGVALDERGFIRIDEFCRTSNPAVYAAGDVAGLPQFVYVAARSGGLAAANAFAAEPVRLDLSGLPRVVFTSPAIAAVGSTEAQARLAGHEPECRVISLGSVPRALVDHQTRGLVKIVVDRLSRRILGAHILAEGAGDVILAATYAMKLGATVEQLADMWAPYLTMGEAVKLAAQSFSREVRLLSCCAA